MRKNFIKMHGLGNDYIYFDCRKSPLNAPEKTAVKLCDRHRSIGGDGIILIENSAVADAKMRIFNSDGSEGKMCGNGIRCMGKYLFDSGIVRKKRLTVETSSGIKTLTVFVGANGKAERLCVNMGRADFSCKSVGVPLVGEWVEKPLTAEGKAYACTLVSVGNPHLVVFSAIPHNFTQIACALQQNPLFSEGINVEFAERRAEGFFVRVYERGSGETLACGTGACAVAAAAVKLGLSMPNRKISVQLTGGTLVVECTEEGIYMTGEASLAYVGKTQV